MIRKICWGLAISLVTVLVIAQMPRTAAPDNAMVYFINLQDGDRIQSPFLVQFGLKGMGVAPLGAMFDNTGHHHILINLDESTIDYNLPLPTTDNIRHFGGGQTETMLELESGTYTLQLLLGDFSHVPHDPPVISEKITITVE